MNKRDTLYKQIDLAGQHLPPQVVSERQRGFREGRIRNITVRTDSGSTTPYFLPANNNQLLPVGCTQLPNFHIEGNSMKKDKSAPWHRVEQHRSSRGWKLPRDIQWAIMRLEQKLKCSGLNVICRAVLELFQTQIGDLDKDIAKSPDKFRMFSPTGEQRQDDEDELTIQ